MRVALLTNVTAQASLPVLMRLVESQRLDLRHVFFYNTLTAARATPVALLRQFGLRKLVVKGLQAGKGKLRARIARLMGPRFWPPHSAYEFAIAHDLPYTLLDDMNTPQARDQLSALAIDVLIVCVCKNILRAPLLALPGVEFVNIHPSLLPNYRGPMPTFWMLYHGEQQTGFTIHRMTTQIDCGAILAQCSLPLDYQQSEQEIEKLVFTAAAGALEGALGRLFETPPILTSGPQRNGSYHSYPTSAQRAELQQRLASRRKRSS